MENLPPEILQRICIRLDLKQRFHCALACRRLWSTLDRTCLFYNIDICSHVNKFLKLIEMFKQCPHRAAQVRELSLFNTIPKDFNKRTLCNIFPNAREVIVECSHSLGDPITHFTKVLEMKSLKSTVEILSDGNYCELATQLITSNLCDRLKTLQLDFEEIKDDSRPIVAQLKNMPVLETLVLSSPHISVIDLHTLHENIPTIRDLELNFVTTLNSDMPATVTPISLARFSYSALGYDEQEAVPIWHEYISKKYIKVDEFDYEDDNFRYLDADVVEKSYESGLLQILQRIGQTKNHLTLYRVPDGINVFEALDNGNCKINDFIFDHCEGETLFEFLSQSKQSKHVDSLRLVNTEISLSDSLRNLKSLTSIIISFFGGDYGVVGIDFTHYLNAFPDSLDYLSIKCPFLQLDTELTHTNNITSLQIFCRQLTSELGDVISTCFPQLKTLELDADIEGDLKITIQNPNFRNATFFINRKITYDYGFSFKSASENKPLYYIRNSNGIKPAKHKAIQAVPTVFFECSGKKELDTSITDCISITTLL